MTCELTRNDFWCWAKRLHKLLPTKAPLYKFYKHWAELAEIVYQKYQQGYVFVYEDAQGVPAGILICGIGNLWWIDGKVLMEDLVLSLRPHCTGFGSFAISEMERIANENGCLFICTGSSMLKEDQMVTNMYKKNGFVVYGESYMKEVI